MFSGERRQGAAWGFSPHHLPRSLLAPVSRQDKDQAATPGRAENAALAGDKLLAGAGFSQTAKKARGATTSPAPGGFMSASHARVIREGGTAIEKMAPADWPVGMPVVKSAKE